MSATLRLTRKGTGIELRRGSFEIAIDGQSAGSINRLETTERPLEPGHHILQVRAGRYASRERSFDTADDELVNFRCHAAMVWPRYVASLLIPQLGISLKRE